MDIRFSNGGGQPDHEDPAADSTGPPSFPRALYTQNVTSAIIDARTNGSWANKPIVTNNGSLNTTGVVGPKIIDKDVKICENDDVQVIRFSDSVSGNRKSASDKKSVHDGYDTDVISGYIGHYGRWQFFWTFLLSLFQIPSTFEIFVFVFQVS